MSWLGLSKRALAGLMQSKELSLNAKHSICFLLILLDTDSNFWKKKFTHPDKPPTDALSIQNFPVVFGYVIGICIDKHRTHSPILSGVDKANGWILWLNIRDTFSLGLRFLAPWINILLLSCALVFYAILTPMIPATGIPFQGAHLQMSSQNLWPLCV